MEFLIQVRRSVIGRAVWTEMAEAREAVDRRLRLIETIPTRAWRDHRLTDSMRRSRDASASPLYTRPVDLVAKAFLVRLGVFQTALAAKHPL